MTKLYNKSELSFSLVLIAIYIFGASLCDVLSEIINISKIFTLVFLLIFSSVLFLWIKNNSLLKKYGLCKPNFNPKKFLYYIPLFVLISTNLWFGIKLNYGILESSISVLTMFCVGFVEEIIFRGFLFKSLEKNGIKSAIVISSITFGFGHIINLFSNNFENITSTICQIFYAIAVGFLFVIIFYKGGSLIACILTHSLVNALSIFQNTKTMNVLTEIIVSIIIIIVSISYSIILLKTLNPTKQEVSSSINGSK